MITSTNSEFDLIDIIGNDQRIRDGVMDQKLKRAIVKVIMIA